MIVSLDLEKAKTPAGGDLTIRQLKTLIVLRERGGAMAHNKLAAAADVPKPSLTRMVDALQLVGFLRREKMEHDARLVTVRLTQDGRDFLAGVLGESGGA